MAYEIKKFHRKDLELVDRDELADPYPLADYS